MDQPPASAAANSAGSIPGGAPAARAEPRKVAETMGDSAACTTIIMISGSADSSAQDGTAAAAPVMIQVGIRSASIRPMNPAVARVTASGADPGAVSSRIRRSRPPSARAAPAGPAPAFCSAIQPAVSSGAPSISAGTIVTPNASCAPPASTASASTARPTPAKARSGGISPSGGADPAAAALWAALAARMSSGMREGRWRIMSSAMPMQKAMMAKPKPMVMASSGRAPGNIDSTSAWVTVVGAQRMAVAKPRRQAEYCRRSFSAVTRSSAPLSRACFSPAPISGARRFTEPKFSSTVRKCAPQEMAP